MLSIFKPKPTSVPHDAYQQSEPYGLSADETGKFRTLARWREKAYSDHDSHRVLLFLRLLKQVAGIPGDYIEMGTQYGGTAKLIWDLMDRSATLYCCDTFEGFRQEDIDADKAVGACGFTIDSINPLGPEPVAANITEDRLRTDALRMIVGRVPMSLEAIPAETRFRFVHLDMDLYAPTLGAMEWLWSRLTPGATVIFHDYDCLPNVAKAVDEFLSPRGIVATPMCDRFGSAVAYKPLST